MTVSEVRSPEQVLAYELHGNCYLNITYHCTLRCAFCPKFNGVWEVQGYNLRIRHEPSVDEVMAAIGADISKYQQIVFCGLGESTLRLDVMLEIADRLKARGASIRLNSDGLGSLVHGRDITPELAGRIDALSISMNAHNQSLYQQHCRPHPDYAEHAFEVMLDFARCAKAHVPEVTLTALDGLEGVDIEACRRMAEQLGVGFRRRVLDEVG